MASSDIEELGLIEGTADMSVEYGSTSPTRSLQSSVNLTSSGKKVDFVLVFEKEKEDENENQEREASRQEFEKNLLRNGLELERTEGTLSGVSTIIS